MNSSETSAKYSWPSREQKEDIQDSGDGEEEDIVVGLMLMVFVEGMGMNGHRGCCQNILAVKSRDGRIS